MIRFLFIFLAALTYLTNSTVADASDAPTTSTPKSGASFTVLVAAQISNLGTNISNWANGNGRVLSEVTFCLPTLTGNTVDQNKSLFLYTEGFNRSYTTSALALVNNTGAVDIGFRGGKDFELSIFHAGLQEYQSRHIYTTQNGFIFSALSRDQNGAPVAIIGKLKNNGQLDETFGDDGTVEIDWIDFGIPIQYDDIVGLTETAGGEIRVFLSHHDLTVTVAGILSTGDRDRAFGNSGSKSLNIPKGSRLFDMEPVLGSPDVVAIAYEVPSFRKNLGGSFGIRAINIETLDPVPTFGTGGTYERKFSTGPGIMIDLVPLRQSGGMVVLAGFKKNSSDLRPQRYGIYKFTNDGKDTDFAGNGRRILAPSDTFEMVAEYALQAPDLDLIIGGWRPGKGIAAIKITLERTNVDDEGRLKTNFGNNGLYEETKFSDKFNPGQTITLPNAVSKVGLERPGAIYLFGSASLPGRTCP